MQLAYIYTFRPNFDSTCECEHNIRALFECFDHVENGLKESKPFLSWLVVKIKPNIQANIFKSMEYEVKTSFSSFEIVHSAIF